MSKASTCFLFLLVTFLISVSKKLYNKKNEARIFFEHVYLLDYNVGVVLSRLSNYNINGSGR